MELVELEFPGQSQPLAVTSKALLTQNPGMANPDTLGSVVVLGFIAPKYVGGI